MPIPPTKSTKSWLSPNDAAKLLGVHPNYISKLGREEKIRIKKLANGRHLYSKLDVEEMSNERRAKQRKSKKAPKKNGVKAAPPAVVEKPRNGESARMTPKQAQTAVQKARWVFDGITMGAITSDREALGLLHNILYTGAGR